MGLEDIVQNDDDKPDRVKYNKDRLHKENLCPGCGEQGEQTEQWYWRCTTSRSRCDVLTYIPSGFEMEIE